MKSKNTNYQIPQREKSRGGQESKRQESIYKTKYGRGNSEYQKIDGGGSNVGQDDTQILKNNTSSQPNLSKSLTFESSKNRQNQKIKLTREERQILYLHPSLQKLKKQKKLDEKNVQIKYVNTLKKIKQKSKYLGCKVKVEGKGFTLQNTKQKQSQEEEISKYKFGKEFNRNLRRKLIQKLDNCSQINQSLHNTMDNGVQEMQDAIKLHYNKSNVYTDFTSKRMENYLKSVSTQKLKMPYFSKKGLQKTFQRIKLNLSPTHTSRKTSNLDTQRYIEEYNLPNFLQSQKTNQNSKNTTAEKWTQLLAEYADDIEQFSQICDFFQKIQHELLRYMPNNHLSNKINMIISQVEHGKAIRKIYDHCNYDISAITPQIIVRFLKEEEGLLSSMNYIVNIIKLNISAERKKRFWDVEKTISKYQQLTVNTANAISNKLKTIDDMEIKKNINETVKKTNTNCRGLDPVYLQFVKQAEKQQNSTISSIKNRNIICQILKFEALIK